MSDGVQIPFIEHARKTLNESGISKLQLQFTLLMDEMKIKQGLVFSKSTKEIIGFTNLSTVNHELSILTEETDSSTESSLASDQIAKQMLVFMIRPIFKPSISFPVALYPSSNLSREELYPVVMEVVEALELWALPVLAITSDGASPNRKFYKLCKLPGGPAVPYKTKNPYADRDLYFFFVHNILFTGTNIAIWLILSSHSL